MEGEDEAVHLNSREQDLDKAERCRPYSGKIAAARSIKSPSLVEAKFRRISIKTVTLPVDGLLITQGPDDGEEEDKEIQAIDPGDWLRHLEQVHVRSGDDGDDSSSDNVSDDSDCQHGFYNVDITVDNGYDTDLATNDEDFLNGPEIFDPSGITDYSEECQRLGIVPCSYFKRHVYDKQFIMKNHGLGPLGARAISKGLEMNSNIEKIDLEGNSIEADGAKYISDVLRDNIYITELVLSENKLESFGAQCICEMLKENSVIRTLDLSGNNFHDSDGEVFQNMLENNSTLRRLYLSHNNFDVEASKAFRDGLSSNESLRLLDLSWNNIRYKGAVYIAEGVKENYGLKELYLSMNGFAIEGSRAMGTALKSNQCLEQLDLSNNRIPAEGALEIAKALQANSDLKMLKIGGNPIGMSGALTLLTAINKNENTEMEVLHMAGVFVDEDFEALHTKMTETRELQVIHDGLMSKMKKVKIQYKTKSYNAVDNFENDPMTKLRKYADAAGLRLVDLFKQFDKDKSWTVDHDEFRQGVAELIKLYPKTKSSGITMDEDEIKALIIKMDTNGDGEIDYREFTAGDNEQKENKRKIGKLIAKKKLTPSIQQDTSSEGMLKSLDEATADKSHPENRPVITKSLTPTPPHPVT